MVPSAVSHMSTYYIGDRRKCDNIVPLLAAGDAATATAAAVAAADGEMRGFFGEIFFAAGCKRLRSFKKSARQKNETQKKNKLVKIGIFSVFLFVNCLKIGFKERHRRKKNNNETPVRRLLLLSVYWWSVLS